MRGRLACGTALALVLAGSAHGQPASTIGDAEAARLEAVLRAQHPQRGDVGVPEAAATLHLGDSFYFLGPAEAKQVLKEWGNPPDQLDGVLGMVFPRGKTFLDQTWGAVLTYAPSGYIPDKDANADYDAFLKDSQKGEDADNKAREKNGFEPIRTVGWAQPPSYDRTHHSLIWARELKFGNQPDHTLNYDVRLLGRRGYLSLNLISTMSKLPSVRADATKLAEATGFNPGSTYADFHAGSDKKAEFGIAGLVAAGVGAAAASKLGLFAVIAAFAKKFVVLLAAAFAGVANWARRLFRKKPPE